MKRTNLYSTKIVQRGLGKQTTDLLLDGKSVSYTTRELQKTNPDISYGAVSSFNKHINSGRIEAIESGGQSLDTYVMEQSLSTLKNLYDLLNVIDTKIKEHIDNENPFVLKAFIEEKRRLIETNMKRLGELSVIKQNLQINQFNFSDFSSQMYLFLKDLEKQNKIQILDEDLKRKVGV